MSHVYDESWDSVPIVKVKRHTRGQFVIDCPHCGKEHSHGAGYGGRVAHCDPPRPETWTQGYRIVTDEEYAARSE